MPKKAVKKITKKIIKKLTEKPGTGIVPKAGAAESTDRSFFDDVRQILADAKR